mmetsp:Transcript_99995/g.322405  ORF Transcript_99995/g.322405 Transcript_99995/m.322405 type:complete len:212 (-) Transcript_99995:1031-1666(-)
MEVGLHGFVGVEADLVVEAWGAIVCRGGSFVACPSPLKQQVVGVDLLDPKLGKASPEVCILLAVVLRTRVALLLSLLVNLQSLHVEDLDGPVETQLAVLQPHRSARAALRRPAVLHHLLEAVGEEDGVWVDLHDPVVPPGFRVRYDALPVTAEDRRVQCRVELTAYLRLETAVHDVAVGWLIPVLQQHLLTAVDSPVVASENANAVTVLDL